MKRTLAMLAGLVLATSAAHGGDVNVVLDSTNGASAFRVLDQASNALMDVQSGTVLRLGRISPSNFLDQQQMDFTESMIVSPPKTAWQSFTVGRAGRLSQILWWNDHYLMNVDTGRIQLRAGEGTGGAILWSKDVTWNEYWLLTDVDSIIDVSKEDVLTIEVLATIEDLEPGYAAGNPYPHGRSSEGEDYDFLFATYITPLSTNVPLVSVPSGKLGVGMEPTPSSERLTVAGNAVITGSVTAASFGGNGAGLTNIGNAALAAGANIEPVKIAGTAVTLASASGGDLSGSFGNLQLKANAVGADEIMNGAVVRSLNTFRDNVTLAAGRNLTVSNAGGVITVDAGGPEVGLPPTAIVMSLNPTNRELERANFSLLYKTEHRDTWIQAAASADWTQRMGHAMLNFNSRLWVLGGLSGAPAHLADVWSSTNGVNWTLATASPGWAARHSHAATVYNNRMWIMGGEGASGWLHDVWSSTNGVNWTQATSAAPWAVRSAFGLLNYAGKMWVIGGDYDVFYGSEYNDVWHSTNGAAWTRATSNADWSVRGGHGAGVFDGKMWVWGGYGEGTYYNDVWNSSNGSNWTLVSASAGWSPRDRFAALVYDGRLWTLGGANGPYSDVWNSGDGLHWVQVTNRAPWPERGYFAGSVLDDRLWISGGVGGMYYRDVWYGGKPDTLSGFYLYQKR